VQNSTSPAKGEKTFPGTEQLKTYNIKDLQVDCYFTRPAYLESGFLLTAPEMPLSAELISALKDWNYHAVLSAGTPSMEYSSVMIAMPKSKASGPGEKVNSDEQLKRAEAFYTQCLYYTKILFGTVLTVGVLNANEVMEQVRIACEFIRKERRALLMVRKNAASGNENYLVSHSVNTMILSVIIGNYLKLPNHRLIELGTAALLHEVGMMKLPAQIYLAKRKLSAAEYKDMCRHPLYSYNILKNSNFPMVISAAALEHHERENGSGYPRHLTEGKISEYARIIAVACSYDAICEGRPYKEAKDASTGIVELLRNEGKQYDSEIVKAFVLSLTIYPIGSFVLLSDGRKGQVVDVVPETPKYPIIQILGELTPDGKNKIIATSKDGVSIVRPLAAP
jgi:HD-GYP domain-containing protein (c-di-GMP phosphodiesterase class II)